MRIGWRVFGALALMWLCWPLGRASAGPPYPIFQKPYTTETPLESFLVFATTPRSDVPDGQIHWTGSEVPGIDTLGPDGEVRNMCPDGGRAWSLASGDPFGGEQFVAVECGGAAEGWQMLAFHLCEVKIRFSIADSARVYTDVPAGGLLARECGGHTHLSLGYWATDGQSLELPCPQWYVQGRYWVNAACLAQAPAVPAALSLQLNLSDDWELRYLTPEVLEPFRQGALVIVIVGLAGYVLRGLLWSPAPTEVNRRESPALDSLAHTGIWITFLALLILLSAGPLWPIGGAAPSGFTAADAPYQQLAQQTGFSDWRLLKAFYMAAVPRGADGRPVAPGEAGKVFPPEAAAAIPFGETNAAAWGLTDPTVPGAYGRDLAWNAVTTRWPASFYEQNLLGTSVSREAQQQRAGLQALADNAALQALGRQLGKTIRPQNLYGSSAGAVGRTQVLPSHLAPSGLCGDMPSLDVWNDPQAIAECTTRYLTTGGCWGSWWVNGDVWSAMCSYNPGAWGSATDQWYWDVLRDRMTRLTALRALVVSQALTNATSITATTLSNEHYVSTPILGWLMAQALLQDGQTTYHLPGPLNDWVAQLAPALRNQHPMLYGLYRLFRAWTLLFYTPHQLLDLGLTF
jgi:hypothetical protein